MQYFLQEIPDSLIGKESVYIFEKPVWIVVFMYPNIIYSKYNFSNDDQILVFHPNCIVWISSLKLHFRGLFSHEQLQTVYLFRASKMKNHCHSFRKLMLFYIKKTNNTSLNLNCIHYEDFSKNLSFWKDVFIIFPWREKLYPQN